MKITDFKNELTKKYPSIMGIEKNNKMVSACIDILTPSYIGSPEKECINLFEALCNVFDDALNHNPNFVYTSIKKMLEILIYISIK